MPLIVKNRVIGVIDLQSEQVGYFQPEHRRLLELTASRVAQAIENARLYTRVARQAQTLAVLNEIRGKSLRFSISIPCWSASASCCGGSSITRCSASCW